MSETNDGPAPLTVQDTLRDNKAAFDAVTAAQKLVIKLEELGLHKEVKALDATRRTVAKKLDASRINVVNAFLILNGMKPFGAQSLSKARHLFELIKHEAK